MVSFLRPLNCVNLSLFHIIYIAIYGILDLLTVFFPSFTLQSIYGIASCCVVNHCNIKISLSDAGYK